MSCSQHHFRARSNAAFPGHPLLRLLAGAAIAIGAACAAMSTAAQPYPVKPIRVIVPIGAGSVIDMTARVLSIHMGKALGQPMVVENITGAGGVTGTLQMVRAPKDGYTIALVNNAHVINPGILSTTAMAVTYEAMTVGAKAGLAIRDFANWRYCRSAGSRNPDTNGHITSRWGWKTG